MNQNNLKLCGEILNNDSYIKQAQSSLNKRENLIKLLLSQRILPDEGWDDLTIQHFITTLAMMDTNNFTNKVGIGEREGRIYSSIVAQKNFNLGHGIGRSGDISGVQPKAAGSSLIYKITKHLVKDAIKICGYQSVKDVLVLPLATGMSLSLCLLTLKTNRPKAQYVIWPRIDQKTCLKCVMTANLTPLVIENIVDGDCLITDLEEINNQINKVGPENVLCILATTSCFSPRAPDKIEDIAILCKKFEIPFVVNNAYGLQCTKIANQFNMAILKGRVDLVVQSTDKNFLVPVGGSVVFSYNKELIKQVSEMYPGRASSAPIVDLFITLLSMGKQGMTYMKQQGLMQLLDERKQNLKYMKVKLEEFATKHEERILKNSQNTISIGLTLSKLKNYLSNEYEKNDVTKLGSYLYSKNVMGSRILTERPSIKQCGIQFKNYGSHCESYPNLPYMTVACAIGMSKQEIDLFIKKLESCFEELQDKKLDKVISHQL